MIRVRALSLFAPFGSFIAGGFKTYETRTWQTSYRGLVLIQQGKTFPRICRDLSETAEAARLLRQMGYARTLDLPLGKDVALTRLVACHRTEEIRSKLSAEELGWGCYDDGRYAWELELLLRILPERPARGQQGLYEAFIPDEWATGTRTQGRELAKPLVIEPAGPPPVNDHRAGLLQSLTRTEEFADLPLPAAEIDEDDR